MPSEASFSFSARSGQSLSDYPRTNPVASSIFSTVHLIATQNHSSSLKLSMMLVSTLQHASFVLSLLLHPTFAEHPFAYLIAFTRLGSALAGSPSALLAVFVASFLAVLGVLAAVIFAAAASRKQRHAGLAPSFARALRVSVVIVTTGLAVPILSVALRTLFFALADSQTRAGSPFASSTVATVSAVAAVTLIATFSAFALVFTFLAKTISHGDALLSPVATLFPHVEIAILVTKIALVFSFLSDSTAPAADATRRVACVLAGFVPLILTIRFPPFILFASNAIVGAQYGAMFATAILYACCSSFMTSEATALFVPTFLLGGAAGYYIVKRTEQVVRASVWNRALDVMSAVCIDAQARSSPAQSSLAPGSAPTSFSGAVSRTFSPAPLAPPPASLPIRSPYDAHVATRHVVSTVSALIAQQVAAASATPVFVPSISDLHEAAVAVFKPEPYTVIALASSRPATGRVLTHRRLSVTELAPLSATLLRSPSAGSFSRDETSPRSRQETSPSPNHAYSDASYEVSDADDKRDFADSHDRRSIASRGSFFSKLRPELPSVTPKPLVPQVQQVQQVHWSADVSPEQLGAEALARVLATDAIRADIRVALAILQSAMSQFPGDVSVLISYASFALFFRPELQHDALRRLQRCLSGPASRSHGYGHLPFPRVFAACFLARVQLIIDQSRQGEASILAHLSVRRNMALATSHSKQAKKLSRRMWRQVGSLQRHHHSITKAQVASFFATATRLQSTVAMAQHAYAGLLQTPSPAVIISYAQFVRASLRRPEDAERLEAVAEQIDGRSAGSGSVHVGPVATVTSMSPPAELDQLDQLVCNHGPRRRHPLHLSISAVFTLFLLTSVLVGLTIGARHALITTSAQTWHDAAWTMRWAGEVQLLSILQSFAVQGFKLGEPSAIASLYASTELLRTALALTCSGERPDAALDAMVAPVQSAFSVQLAGEPVANFEPLELTFSNVGAMQACFSPLEEVIDFDVVLEIPDDDAFRLVSLTSPGHSVATHLIAMALDLTTCHLYAAGDLDPPTGADSDTSCSSHVTGAESAILDLIDHTSIDVTGELFADAFSLSAEETDSAATSIFTVAVASALLVALAAGVAQMVVFVLLAAIRRRHDRHLIASVLSTPAAGVARFSASKAYQPRPVDSSYDGPIHASPIPFNTMPSRRRSVQFSTLQAPSSDASSPRSACSPTDTDMTCPTPSVSRVSADRVTPPISRPTSGGLFPSHSELTTERLSTADASDTDFPHDPHHSHSLPEHERMFSASVAHALKHVSGLVSRDLAIFAAVSLLLVIPAFVFTAGSLKHVASIDRINGFLSLALPRVSLPVRLSCELFHVISGAEEYVTSPTDSHAAELAEELAMATDTFQSLQIAHEGVIDALSYFSADAYSLHYSSGSCLRLWTDGLCPPTSYTVPVTSGLDALMRQFLSAAERILATAPLDLTTDLDDFQFLRGVAVTDAASGCYQLVSEVMQDVEEETDAIVASVNLSTTVLGCLLGLSCAFTLPYIHKAYKRNQRSQELVALIAVYHTEADAQ
jgi:hypothetical protein